MVLGRLMLMAGVLVLAYCLPLAGTAMPWLAAGVLCFLAYLIKHSRKRMTTLGSARWPDTDDLIIF
jgi:threonine/homoserine/homoserine lactone efflux protein